MAKLASYLPNKVQRELEKYPGLGKILENVGWLFVDKILVMGTGLFVMVWMANYLGEENYGKYNFGRAFIEFFVVISTLGLESIVIRDIVKKPELKDRILGTTFGLRLMGGFLMVVCSVIGIMIIRPEDHQMHIIVSIFASAYIFKSVETIDFWFQSQVQSKYAVWARNVAFLIITALKIYFILSTRSLIHFVVLEVLLDVLSVIGLVVMYRHAGNVISKWKFEWGLAKSLIKEGMPMLLSTVMIVIYIKLDQVMLGQIIDDNDKSVGIYSVAAKLSEIWYFIPMILGSSLFPSLIKSKELGEETYLNRFQSYFDLNAGIAILISLPASLLAPFLFGFLFPDKYHGADLMFSIHIWAAVFVFLGVARNNYLVNEGLLKEAFLFTVMGAVSNIGLNYWLIPLYQGYGAAVATLISYMISGYLTSFMVPKLYGIGWMQTKAILIPFLFPKYLKK